MHLSAGGDFEQQALSQMLDFHEGLGGWLGGQEGARRGPGGDQESARGVPGGGQEGIRKGPGGGQERAKKGTKMRQKRVPLARKCVKNVYP